FIKLVNDEVGPILIKVLTSREHIKNVTKGDPQEEFSSAWRELSDMAPPDIEIIIVGYGNKGTHPIHDRWLISNGKGLRFGTSINSVGITRTTEISELNLEQYK